jgi:hypothetical protein
VIYLRVSSLRVCFVYRPRLPFLFKLCSMFFALSFIRHFIFIFYLFWLQLVFFIFAIFMFICFARSAVICRPYTVCIIVTYCTVYCIMYIVTPCRFALVICWVYSRLYYSNIVQRFFVVDRRMFFMFSFYSLYL